MIIESRRDKVLFSAGKEADSLIGSSELGAIVTFMVIVISPSLDRYSSTMRYKLMGRVKFVVA
jgi:hypothetical protein